MSLASRFERMKSRRKRHATRPVHLNLEAMEDRTVPAQAVAVGPNLSLLGLGSNSGTKIGDTLYFIAHQGTDAANVSEIWQVSGTATAQELNVPALAGMSLGEIANVGGTLYITAASTPTVTPPTLPVTNAAVNLWKIDAAAPGGAVELTNFTGSGALNLQVVGNEVLFDHRTFSDPVPTQSFDELWASDGTVAGTKLVYAFTGDAHPDLIDSAVAGGSLYFQVNAYVSPAQPALWVSDGTAAGTQAVTGMGGSPLAPLDGFSLTAAGNAVIFATTDGNQADLWMAQNGQASIVQSFTGNGNATTPVINGITAANGDVYFALYRNNGVEVWTSDGTTAGTTPVYQAPAGSPATPMSPYVGDIAVLNGSVYFTLVNGGGLMKADGHGGATPVPVPAGLSGESFVSDIGNRLYFMADDGVHGTELWSTDGSTGGTVRMTDINPGSGSSFPIGPEEAGGALYVVASDGVPAGPSYFAPQKLWMLPDPAAPAGAAATITLTPSAPIVTTGAPVTLTATVKAVDPTQPAPTGQVVFRDDMQIYGSAPLLNGVATLAVSISVPGAHNLQAIFTGNGVFDESISAPTTVTAGQSGTTLALTTSDSTADPGQVVTFTATITPALSASQPPSGSVNFFDGTKYLGTGFVNAGVATYQTSTLTAGLHAISASYGGDSTFLPSTSTPLTETVGPSFTVGLTAPSTSPALGQPLTLTAHVTPAPGGSIPAGMTVLFRDAATPIGSAAVNASGIATLTISTLGIGTHSLSAVVFNAGSEFDSTAIAVTVKQAATTATLRSTDPTSRQGQNVTLTMTISTPAGMPAATGIVTFKDGPTTLGTASVANNRAVLLVSGLAVGNHPITAAYQGDANFTGSSAALLQTVSPATVATTITVQSSNTTAIVGQQVALSATIVPAVGSATPVGSVAFIDGPTLLASVKIDPTGHALLLTNSLGTGNHTIKAVFGGAGIFAGSTSTPVAVAVRFGAKATLSSATSTITSGQGVALTATVAAAIGGGIQPAGAVTFYDGTTAVGSTAIQNGIAKLTTTPLAAVGLHKLTAVYSGNALFGSTATAVVYVTVRAIGTTITLQPPAQPAAGTGIVTLTATVGVVAPGTGAATGKVTFFEGTTALGTAAVAGGKATLQLPNLGAGSHFLRAVFTATGADSGSSSAVVHYTIAATTSTTLQATAAGFGQTTTLKAAVSVLSPGFGKASGAVIFKDGTAILGTAVLQNGIATLGVKLPTGAHNLTATYAGTTDFAASAAVAMPYTVTRVSPALVFKATPSSPKAGINVVLTIAAGPATAGAFGPTGSILLTDGNTIVGSGFIISGVVTVQTTKLTKGTHTLKATYAGDGNYVAGTSTLTLTIG